MKRRASRTNVLLDEENLAQLLQEVASIQPGSREALRFCFGRLAESAEELKQLETIVEQIDLPFAEEVSPQPPVG
ncbi:hypothetical protein HRbin16_00889 [bacterium HR16]|nr:hypothetical protein HRbin16_00889 [bacterium HR16]